MIFDDAHRVRRQRIGKKVQATKTYELAEELKEAAHGFLLPEACHRHRGRCLRRRARHSIDRRAGKEVGVVPRVFATKFVSDVLDRVDQFEECDPRQDYKLTISYTELTD